MSSDPITFATQHLRTHDFDWYAALQFAPTQKRGACVALFAYVAEVARVRSLVSDPMPGEIRLQWWRDTLTGTSHGAVEANPLAAAILEAIDAYKLPTASLLAVLDARTFDLYDDAMPSMVDFEGYAGEGLSGPMSLAASVLTGDSRARFADVAGHGGVALMAARVLEEFPTWAKRGQCLLPADMMAEHGLVREALTECKPGKELAAALRAFAAYGAGHLAKAKAAQSQTEPLATPVWLSLALAEKTFQTAATWASDPFAKPLTAARWRRLYWLWRASKV